MFFLTFFFFFSSRRRHTRSLCDWSSDVCSSDLVRPLDLPPARMEMESRLGQVIFSSSRRQVQRANVRVLVAASPLVTKIGRASCRERVEISVGAGALIEKSM